MVDVTPQYIEMCVKAPREITEPFTVQYTEAIGALEYHLQTLYCTEHKRIIGYDPMNCPVCGNWLTGSDECDGHWIRLPRQDNLQDIMTKDGGRIRIWRLHEWFNNWIPDGSRPESFEQLWLEFVMCEIYHKCWVDSNWVEEL